MILYVPANVPKIISGEKTVTRRRWKRARCKPGSIHVACVRLFDSEAVFAFLMIEDIHHEELPGAAIWGNGHATNWLADPHRVPTAIRELMVDEAWREGFPNWCAFEDSFTRMHGDIALGIPCWRVQFRVATIGEIRQSLYREAGPNRWYDLRNLYAHGASQRIFDISTPETPEGRASLWPDDRLAICPWFKVETAMANPIPSLRDDPQPDHGPRDQTPSDGARGGERRARTMSDRDVAEGTP